MKLQKERGDFFLSQKDKEYGSSLKMAHVWHVLTRVAIFLMSSSSTATFLDFLSLDFRGDLPSLEAS